MDKKIDAARLLRAMGDVDDKYIEESLATSAPAKRAVTTSLRRYSGVIAAVAAALLLVIVGVGIMKYMSTARSASAEVAPHNGAVEVVNERINTYGFNGSTAEQASEENMQVDGVEEPGAAETTVAYSVSGGDLSLRDSDTGEYMNFVFDSLDDLEEAAQLDFDVPESVDGSVSCTYINCVYDNGMNIAEVNYLDEEGNIICTIRKAFVQRNISGCVDCYSIEDRVEVDGLGSVNLLGNNSGYQVAYWIHGGYSYSVTTVEILSEDAMLELVSHVS